MKSKKSQFKNAVKNQSQHDPNSLIKCPDCGVPFMVAKNGINNKVEAFHHVSRGNGSYGYETTDHGESVRKAKETALKGEDNK